MAKISPYVAIPPIIFLGLAGLFYFGLARENAGDLPSTMIGRDTPSLLKITDLREDSAPTIDDLTADGIKFVNFWASWCGPCRAEHPLLEAMADDGMTLIGINYKDAADNALGFLDELGDPFTKIGADTTGRTGLEWGVYGVPETFVIDGNGKVIYRHPGPLTKRVLDERVFPAIAAAAE
ncbi:thiol:disulfide interchange protein [Rhodobacterales bacterium 52_120_T64]|nr:thiol:disulfide interchange protein [Rhodobacterales bacterium 52_120_T64]